MGQESKRGVLLMAFGGPEQEEAVEPFMTNLMGGRTPSSALLDKVKERYRLIGGGSPLPGIVADQARALQKKLAEQGQDFSVLVGMRYWRPFFGEALEKFAKDGIRQVIALSLSPHYSRVSTGAYLQELQRVLQEQNLNLKVLKAPSWYRHPLFIQALALKVEEGLQGFPPERQSQVQVVFSAHSLPENYIESGDPYVEELLATVEALVKKLGLSAWHLGYQSKGGGQGRWLGPMVEEVLEEISRKGYRDVLVVPAGFTTDHVETLYDIDHVHRSYAEGLGLNFRRTGALNTSPEFIQALAAIVKDAGD